MRSWIGRPSDAAMKMRAIVLAMITATVGEIAAEEPNAFPYDEFAKFSENMPGEKIDGKVLIPAYLKPQDANARIDLAKANFRIRMPDGRELPMKCDVLPANPEETENALDKKKILGGFTHKLWIPKDPAYAGATMLNDLPKAFLDIQFPLPPRPQE